jgi:uncharacterized protein related to proFAR isomerase
MKRNWEVTSELEKLEKDLAGLQARHLELLDLVDYFKSESFIETEARDKLGLKKEGEQVAVILDLDTTSTLESLWGQQDEEEEEVVSNPRKWWRHFFEPRTK